ncbi:uncharacterized protein CCR75_009474 [Bremia lactucae]|uniref:Uncharacterized protein n=1 Tax=Bremia lactucae TaxID=4779 RepID=A0A976ICF7_BRELC|nr:hypothetical protein CCR75_009474 [Bremia lactucae]
MIQVIKRFDDSRTQELWLKFTEAPSPMNLVSRNPIEFVQLFHQLLRPTPCPLLEVLHLHE